MVIVEKEAIIPECKRDDPVAYNLTVSDTGTKFNWNEEIQGLILGAWFYGYMTSSLPAGFIVEWAGPFLILFLSIGISGVLNSLCVVLIPIHWGYLFFTRYVIGFAGGFIYPALQCLIGRWAPPQEHGKFVGGLVGNGLGVAFTWIVVGAVTKAYKWTWGFHVISFEIIVYLILLFIFIADSPEEHRWMSSEELHYIKTSQEGHVSKTRAVPPYKAILTSVPFWALATLNFGHMWGMNTQITAVPKFMKEVIGFDIKTSGLLSSLPHLTRVGVGTICGIFGDWLKNTKFKRNTVLKVAVIFSHILPGLFLCSMSLVKCNEVGATTLLVLSMSINGVAVLTSLSNAIDLSPNFAGTIYGLQSFIGGITGFIVPSITATFITIFGNNYKAWSMSFVLGGFIYCMSGVVFIIFGTSKIQPWNEKKDDPAVASQSNA